MKSYRTKNNTTLYNNPKTFKKLETEYINAINKLLLKSLSSK